MSKWYMSLEDDISRSHCYTNGNSRSIELNQYHTTSTHLKLRSNFWSSCAKKNCSTTSMDLKEKLNTVKSIKRGSNSWINGWRTFAFSQEITAHKNYSSNSANPKILLDKVKSTILTFQYLDSWCYLDL